MTLVTSAASIAGSQPADGDVTMKCEEEQRAEGEDKGSCTERCLTVSTLQ